MSWLDKWLIHLLWEAEIGATRGLKLEVSWRVRLHEILGVKDFDSLQKEEIESLSDTGPKLGSGCKAK